ncbi:hypothetical protein FF52_20802 [Flavobacterium sp. F52]|nr:hypothetical protein FF52_20802 [Flavobacterium sp. F52]
MRISVLNCNEFLLWPRDAKALSFFLFPIAIGIKGLKGLRSFFCQDDKLYASFYLKKNFAS